MPPAQAENAGASMQTVTESSAHPDAVPNGDPSEPAVTSTEPVDTPVEARDTTNVTSPNGADGQAPVSPEPSAQHDDTDEGNSAQETAQSVSTPAEATQQDAEPTQEPTAAQDPVTPAESGTTASATESASADDEKDVAAEAATSPADATQEPGTTQDKDSGDFGKLLDETATAPREVKAGDRVRGKIVTIGDEFTFVDYQGRSEARIATSELRDRDGTVLMRVGDMLTATASSVDEAVTLTLGKRRGPVNAARLRVSFESKIPVSGTVKGINKGGFDVNVGGIRAFCPLSQVDNNFVENPKDYVGKTFSFRVLRWENGGRNIVVSRRPILREESKQRAAETRKTLAEGAEFEGVVTRLQPFGAFVDLGGLEGLLHVSRMGHTRVEDPSSVVSKGDKLRVRVVSIENPGTRKERIALSLVDLGPDPWEAVTDAIKEGDVLDGTVARLVPFGAFVRLPNGMDGLVHISELSEKRIKEPKEAVTQGQEVQARVLKVDVEKKRISLSLRLSAASAPTQAKPRREPRAARGAPKEPKTGSPAGGPVSLTHTMADQLGRLKDKLREQE